MLNAFQSLVIKLFFFSKLLKPSVINLPLLSSKTDSPIIIIGLLEEDNFFEKSDSLLKFFLYRLYYCLLLYNRM